MDVLGCFERGADGKLTLCGFTWLLSKTPVGKLFTKAESGWAFFRNQKNTTRWAKLSVEYAFRYLGVDVLFGSTPVKNRAAVIAAKRVGFHVIGELPYYTAWEGEPCSVAISHLTKAAWYKQEGS
jgi:RimJ/RimL family protein N-acetyltransferase